MHKAFQHGLLAATLTMAGAVQAGSVMGSDLLTAPGAACRAAMASTA
jgi:hypothetical protein